MKKKYVKYRNPKTKNCILRIAEMERKNEKERLKIMV